MAIVHPNVPSKIKIETY